MTVLVRSAVLTYYAEVARALNVDPYKQLDAVGLSRSVLLNHDMKIPAQAVARLLESSATLAKVQDFGLRMTNSSQLSDLGGLALIASEKATLRQFLEAISQHIRLHNESIYPSIEDYGNSVIIRMNMLGGHDEPMRQVTELAVGALHRMMRLLVGETWNPNTVCFSHAPPSDLTTHLRMFGNRVRFKQEFDGFVCSAIDLQSANPAFDPSLPPRVHQNVELNLNAPLVSMDDQVRQLVCSLLPTGNCSIERVALELGRDRQTVYRQLAQSNKTFSAIVEDVRCELVSRYLAVRSRPLSEVARLLGFASPSAFSRWFHARFGCSASRWRSSAGRQ